VPLPHHRLQLADLIFGSGVAWWRREPHLAAGTEEPRLPRPGVRLDHISACRLDCHRCWSDHPASEYRRTECRARLQSGSPTESEHCWFLLCHCHTSSRTVFTVRHFVLSATSSSRLPGYPTASDGTDAPRVRRARAGYAYVRRIPRHR